MIERNKCLNRRFIATIVILGLAMLFTIPLFAEHKFKRESDSLEYILSQHSEPEIIIPILSRLSLLNEQKPVEISYLKRQYEAAMQIDSIPVAYSALRRLSNYYYNIGNYDSIVYWGNIVDSIASSRKEYPNALFDVKCYACLNLIWKMDYEVAMNMAMSLYRQASKVDQKYGLIRCSETLGLIYRATLRDSDAIVAYQEGLDLLENMEGELETQIRLTCYQLESCLKSYQIDLAEKALKSYEQLANKQKILVEEFGAIYPIKREYWLLYSHYVEFYLQKNELDKAGEYLKKAAKYAGNIFAPGDYVEKTYLFVQAMYYNKIGNLPKALEFIDELLAMERIPDELMLKADILKKQGKLNEALLFYDETLAFNSKRNDEAFHRQINQLRTLHEINNKEARSRELNMNNLRMTHKQQQLIFLLLIVVVLLVLSYVMSVYIRRTQRLKNELKKEKELLLESGEKLKKEKIKADEASRMKSAFIANMSHEIRTPLNAIVGFSGLMLDETTIPEEKKEYTSIIKNNTELMLNLVADVLDLSRMETGDLSFTFKSYPLIECCRKALDSIRHRMPEGVKLTFTPAVESIIIYTDILRLQQLLTNLMTNSIKFTLQGEINLSYELIDEGKNVRIAVTDTGYGIPLEKQADIFKRFEKLDDYKPGAGLGLSICSLIAVNLKGSISIDSTYTTGARFFFIHPCEIPGEAYSQETAEIN